jgi:dynactin-6
MSSEQVFCCKNIEIEGQIAFGTGCIIHPDCSIIAEGGPIIFGEYNIIEEKVRIINRAERDSEGNVISNKKPMQIGNYNLFEVGTVIENSEIGNYNIFQHRTKIEGGSSVENGSVVTSGVTVSSGSSVPSNVVVYNFGRLRTNTNY